MSSPLSQLQCKRSLVANDGDANDGVFLQMIEMFLTPLYVCMYVCLYVCMYICTYIYFLQMMVMFLTPFARD